MKILGWSTLLVPDAFLPSLAVLLFSLAGLAWIVGLRKVGSGLIGLAVVALLSPAFAPIVAEVVAALPAPILLLVIAVLVIAVAGRFLRDVAVQVCANLVSGVIRWAFTSRVGLVSIAIAAAAVWASL